MLFRSSFMSQVKSAATQTFDGKAFAQNMAAMLTGSEQNKLWRSFTRSVLSMMTEISFLLKQAMVGIVGSIGKALICFQHDHCCFCQDQCHGPHFQYHLL